MRTNHAAAPETPTIEKLAVAACRGIAGMVALCCVIVAPVEASAIEQSRQQAVRIVSQIQRADYEGDRAALKHLPLKLLPFIENKELAARARYWRGFALWRRAINGFNETPTPTDLEDDLQEAVSEFEQASARDPDFVDAKIAEVSCRGYLWYLHRNDPAQMQAYIAKISPMLKDLKNSAADNPRLYWVLGPMYWSRPAESGGGPAKAFEIYQKGLDAVRQHNATATDPMDPSWGEPELLMNLAWSKLNQSPIWKRPSVMPSQPCTWFRTGTTSATF